MLGLLNNYFFFIFLTSLALSNNLILFFISWIGMNITLYGILLKSYNTYNKEITLKYFVSGSVVTIFILFSILLYFLDYQSFNIESSSYLYFINNLMIDSYNIIFISKIQKIFYTLIISAFLFKLGAFPFHFYIPDMYSSLRLMKTMFFYSIVLKIIIFFTLLKYLSCFWYLNQTIVDLLVCSGFGSIFVSSFSILKQYKLMNFWAYSYINSVGYTLISLSSGIGYEYGELSFYSAKIYFLSYLLVWYGIIDLMRSFDIIKFKNNNLIIRNSIYYVNELMLVSHNYINIKNVNNNINLKSIKNGKVTRYSLVIFTLSLFGLPPTVGFYTKAIVYFDLISNQSTSFILVLLLLISPIICVAYLKILIYCLNTNTTVNFNTKSYIIPKSKNGFKINFLTIANLIVILPFIFIINEFLSIYINTINWR